MNIGLLGFGVVGGGVWELAQENRALNVKKVLVRREAPSLGKAAVQDVEAILRDPDIDTVVEVGIPNELKMSSNTMSVTITAR